MGIDFLEILWYNKCKQCEYPEEMKAAAWEIDMTYQEFMKWAEENEELKAIIPDFWHNKDDVMERLVYIGIFPNKYCRR